ncbi:MAG: secondary thiamine-phosphate synthase enzyme YjbQ [Nitrospirota bacterium]|nr:secondary thiamine-phosphate synthase enzyme YjbQ [Nitrospirota bacterium]
MFELAIKTEARVQSLDITPRIEQKIQEIGLKEGAVLIFSPHSTAAVTINENADPNVQKDLLEALERLVPWAPSYSHAEGNAEAHIKTSLIGPSVLVPVEAGSLKLGPWQGVLFLEFDGPRARKLWVRPMLPWE